MNYLDSYKASLAKFFGLLPENIFLFWKGRVALYATLKAMGVKQGDEVILPAFTCVVVPNAIIYLGAKPIYVDIDPATFNVNIDLIEAKITSKTKAIIAQNTFGLSDNVDAIISLAKKHSLYTIEDCTHGFGGMYKGRKNGTIADASFFSSQWNKPFSTGIGGFAVVKNERLIQKMLDLEKLAVKPSWLETKFLGLLLFIRNKLLFPSVYWNAIRLYRFLSENNLVIGSSQGEELERPDLPRNFLKRMSDIQASTGIVEMAKIENFTEHRLDLAKRYEKYLLNLGIKPTYDASVKDHIYLKYPILVRNRKKFLANARVQQIEIGDWFLSPIHPIEKHYRYWYYEYGQNVNAEIVSRHIVNLPTARNIDEAYFSTICKFLEANIDQIIPDISAFVNEYAAPKLYPQVSIIIPCRNEEKYIGKCLQSIVDCEYPKDLLNVYVCDGLSTDNTVATIKTMTEKNPFIHLLINEKQTTQFALNLGLNRDESEIKIILSAHAEIYPDYVDQCIAAFRQDPEIVCVGGSMNNISEDEKTLCISKAMSSPFGIGDAHFRTGLFEGYADTVPFGAYKKVVFETIGYFDEELVRNQDDEFNFRIKKHGFRIFLSRNIKSKYYVRASFRMLFRQYYQYGYWKAYVNKKHQTLFSVRQIIPFLFVMGLLVGFGLFTKNILQEFYIACLFLYAALSFYFSAKLAQSIHEFFKISLSFFILHFSYGWGYLVGLIAFVILGRKPSELSKKMTR